MRLIDADVLKQHIDKLPALPDGNFAGNHSALKTLINMQPTIESSTNCSEIQNSSDCISRQAAIDAIRASRMIYSGTWGKGLVMAEERLRDLPSAQPEQRYTEEELRVFQHGISLSLLSKRSSQHWQYDEDTATEIKFLERLYEKVVADMRGEQDGRFNQQTGGD